MSDEDRIAQMVERIVLRVLSMPRLDAFGIYGATVLAIRPGSGNLDVLCDNKDIGYVNDCDIYPGIAGLQVTPVTQSTIEKGARCLLLWREGNKQLKTVIAFASAPENSLRKLALVVREEVLLRVPSFIADGDTTTQRLLSNGTTPALPLPGPALGGPDPAITGLSGTDMAFTLTMKAATGNMPPPSVGVLALVAFGGGLFPGTVHPVISAGAGAGGLGLSCTSLGFGLVISCSVPPVPGITFSCSVHTIGTS